MKHLNAVSPQRVLSLAEEINLPNDVCCSIADEISKDVLLRFKEETTALTNCDTAPLAFKRLEQRFAEQGSGGMALLTIYLSAACITRDIYKKCGLSDELFISTMGCFTRFVNESKAREGKYAFSRAFWAWRHLSCVLFRLGALEFEYRLISNSEALPAGVHAGDPVLSVHIPSDAALNKQGLQGSYNMAKHFFEEEGARFCLYGEPKAIICGTWLLSDELKAWLKPNSGILTFAKDYEIYKRNPEDETFYLWLFNGQILPQNLPQQTSLQRQAALHLQNGGKIGSAYGIKAF